MSQSEELSSQTEKGPRGRGGEEHHRHSGTKAAEDQVSGLRHHPRRREGNYSEEHSPFLSHEEADETEYDTKFEGSLSETASSRSLSLPSDTEHSLAPDQVFEDYNDEVWCSMWGER